eukprot:TRINITY_DN69959_c0_g1_i1.p1 TRINITY_DN69959_c0_g1~~TRINITY_DN69959_c0_g1_i1.p1  ORF type:complete len:274 (+),score=46.35 TRINITY_DN69959_c0_g1_i1:26-847(+)
MATLMATTSPLRRHRLDAELTAEQGAEGCSHIEQVPSPSSHKAVSSRSPIRPPLPAVQASAPVMNTSLRLVQMVAGLLLGTAMSAAALLAAASPAALERMALVERYRLGPLFLALVLLHLAYHTAGAQLGTVHRPMQVRMPDQKVYRVLDGGPGISGALVLTEDGGAFARYVRTQQAAVSLEASMPLFVAHVLAGGFVLPWTSMALSAAFGLGRATRAAHCAAFGLTPSSQEQELSGSRRPVRALSPSGLAEGAAAGVCLFVGLLATARELTG